MNYRQAYMEQRAILDRIAESTKTFIDIDNNSICQIVMTPEEANTFFAASSLLDDYEQDPDEANEQAADSVRVLFTEDD